MHEVDRVLIAKSKNKNKNLFSKLWNYLKKNFPLEVYM